MATRKNETPPSRPAPQAPMSRPAAGTIVRLHDTRTAFSLALVTKVNPKKLRASLLEKFREWSAGTELDVPGNPPPATQADVEKLVGGPAPCWAPEHGSATIEAIVWPKSYTIHRPYTTSGVVGNILHFWHETLGIVHGVVTERVDNGHQDTWLRFHNGWYVHESRVGNESHKAFKPGGVERVDGTKVKPPVATDPSRIPGLNLEEYAWIQKIGVAKAKVSRGRQFECGYSFTADVLFDGETIALAMDEGTGGPVRIEPTSGKSWADLDAKLKSRFMEVYGKAIVAAGGDAGYRPIEALETLIALVAVDKVPLLQAFRERAESDAKFSIESAAFEKARNEREAAALAAAPEPQQVDTATARVALKGIVRGVRRLIDLGAEIEGDTIVIERPQKPWGKESLSGNIEIRYVGNGRFVASYVDGDSKTEITGHKGLPAEQTPGEPRNLTDVINEFLHPVKKR
jgi:hypothetical protein